MFDPVTAAFLRTAPALPQLNPQTLPQMLTARYAELVARRLRRTGRKPLKEIEQALGGDVQKDRECPRARRLVTSVVPLGLTFIAGLVARAVS